MFENSRIHVILYTDSGHILKEFGEELQNFKIILMPSGFSGRRWFMLMFSFLFRFAHDKHALLDLETIDDDLDQIGETIYCLLLFLVKYPLLPFINAFYLLPHFVTTTFCYFLLLSIVIFCYLLLSFVSYFLFFKVFIWFD